MVNSVRSIRRTPISRLAAATLVAAALAFPAAAANNPSSVNESAPARTGSASVPTGGSNPSIRSSENVALPKSPSSVNESAPARTGTSTPTGAPSHAMRMGTEPTDHKMKTPSSVNESAPAQTGKQTTPTAKGKKHRRSAMRFDDADMNKDGNVDRMEFDSYMAKHR